MAKTSGKTSSNPRGRRPAAGGAKRNAPSPLTTLFGGLKDLMKVNFDNRRIPTLIGLALAACSLFACLALITFLFSGGSDQSLIYAARDGEAATELGREAKNILGLPGARLADYLFNQLFGWGLSSHSPTSSTSLRTSSGVPVSRPTATSQASSSMASSCSGSP